MAGTQASAAQQSQRSNLLESHNLAYRTQNDDAIPTARPGSLHSACETSTGNTPRPIREIATLQHNTNQLEPHQASPSDAEQSGLQSGSIDRSTQDLKIGLSSIDVLDEPDLDPPVTKDTLQVLELPWIINDPRLRYDLCFDENIEFKPATNCWNGCEMYKRAQEYYRALRVELVTLLGQRSDVALGGRNIQLTRIPRMFKSIRETLEDLCPAAERPAINEQLDADLLIQQIQHGVLDFAKLGEWLCQLLMRSCAPVRDDFIRGIGSLLKEASMTNSASCLLNGIKRIFGALELMKLDVANHQIRALQAVMVDDYVAFGQKFAITALANSNHTPQLIAAATWFARHSCAGASLSDQPSLSNLATFTQCIINIVVQRQEYVPPTFAFDLTRFMALRCDFHQILYRSAVKNVFDDFLRGIEGWSTIDQSAYRRSLVDLLGLTEIPAARQKSDSRLPGLRHPEFAPDYVSHEFAREMSTAIAVKAYQLLDVEAVPREKIIDEVESSLIDWQEAEISPMLEERLAVHHELADMVGKEIQPLLTLSPTQIRTRMKALEGNVQGTFGQQSLLRISREIAHISILQWRVWGPILYEPFARTPVSMTETLSALMLQLGVSES